MKGCCVVYCTMMVSYVIALYIYMWEQGVPGMPVAGTGRSWYAGSELGIPGMLITHEA